MLEPGPRSSLLDASCPKIVDPMVATPINRISG
jgi:hypothetical protein